MQQDIQTGYRVVILGMGGTIAGRAVRGQDHVAYVAGQVPVADLVGALPVSQHGAFDVEQVAQVDSKDMGFVWWQRLAARVVAHLARPEVGAVVVTHGTDTMEETAFFLQSVLRPAKPVVLTGAMRPATALVPDGPQNLCDALAVARCPGARGVVVAFAGQIHGAHDVRKAHPYKLDAFDSGDAGALGCVQNGVVRLFRPWPAACETGVFDEAGYARVRQSAALPPVGLLWSHADADGSVVQALLGQSVRAMVVAGTGNGTVHESLEQALLQAQAQGVRVVRTSRCEGAQLVPEVPDAAQGKQGLWEVCGLSPVKARIALGLALLDGGPIRGGVV